MHQSETALTFYSNNILELNKLLQQLKSKSSQIAWARFIVFLATAFSIKQLWGSSVIVIVAIGTAGLSCFLWMLSLSSNNRRKQNNTTALIDLNKQEIEILNNNYLHRNDGATFKQADHNYENDLDIFGKASLYQYLNRCVSEQGKCLLAKQLLTAQSTDFILQQQEAVKELSTKMSWAQQFIAYGIENNVTKSTEEKINNWLKEKNTVFIWQGWNWFIHIYSAITLASLMLYIVDVFPSSIFYPLTTLYFLFALYQSKKVHKTYIQLGKIVDEVATLQVQLKWLEEETFSSKLFNHIQSNISNNNQTKASVQILHLKQILDRFDARLNVFLFFFLNSFLLWDVRQMLALIHWKKNNKELLNHWFKAIASTEVSISLATLYFNQPQFVFPTISNTHFEFTATDLGHPLIAENKRVNNSFTLNGIGKTALITGSNMGGKSTFLRSIGINTVLALMGAPVCAKAFTVSNVELMSSMRIADNLAESTSTFYAELKKIQSIIEAVKAQKKVFILLDEILRGTNSLDRHTGSKALIQQLIQQNAVAIIATHDVELANLETQLPNAINYYHFDVQVSNEELYFDYKLKQGVCTSLNASILMKKIGIEMQA